MAGAVLWIISVLMEYGLGMGADSGPLNVVHELVALPALVASSIGYLGLVWGGAFRGRFGAYAVWLHVLAYGLIVLGGIAALLLGDAAGPLLLVFPIGGALQGVATLLLAVAVLATGRWTGWQRWIPLLACIFQILAIDLPMVLGVTPDGPGMSLEIGQGVWWFLVALAVYTAHAASTAAQPSTVGQV